MKPMHIATMKFPFVYCVVCCFLFASVLTRADSSDDRINSALAAAPAWVDQIDSGLYEESYADGAVALRDKTPEQQWVEVLTALRRPWGKMVERKAVRHLYKPDGYEGVGGEFMVITYESSFSKLPSALEVVVLKLEDGKWRGAGYNCVAKNPDDADGQTPTPDTPQTDTSTITTKTPPQ